MENKPNFTRKTNEKIQKLMDLILAVRFSDLEKDFEACTQLLQISEKEGYLYGIAFANAYMGDCLIGKNESVNASANLLRAKELCEKHRFLDLLPYVCTWLGLYYEMQNDRQMAMQYYLDALEFAERNHDLMRQSILLNNIASQFQSCGNAEVAKEYYLRAFHCYAALERSSNQDPHYAQMTANIISVCCQLKQINEAQYYFGLLQKSGQLAENQNQLYLCELLISVAMGNVAATQRSVDDLLLEMRKRHQNLHQFFETFLVVANSLIDLEERDYAHKMLTMLNDLCQQNDYGSRLKVQCVWMRFYKLFGTTDENNQAYALFYELRQRSDDILNRNLADGLLAKIKLRETMKKNKEMEKAQELLEDELQLDELTQLYNRRSFRQLTEQFAADPTVHTLSFIMIDVDYFKQYNDTYGHAKGDAALRAVADSMAWGCDGDIYNFRYGGDEFFTMCKNKTLTEVERYITTLTAALQQKQIPHVGSLCSDFLTLSIGYSLHEREKTGHLDAAQILAEADAALYRAKDRGRNCHSLYGDDAHPGT